MHWPLFLSLRESPQQIRERAFMFGVTNVARELARSGYLLEATETRVREAQYRLKQQYLRSLYDLGLADYHPDGVVEKSEFGYEVHRVRLRKLPHVSIRIEGNCFMPNRLLSAEERL